MKSTTFLAYFLAMFAMFFTVSAQEIAALEERNAVAGVDAVVALLVKDHSSIVLKAYADVCADASLSESIQSNLKVKVSGLVNIDFGLSSKLSGAISTKVKATVKAEVDAEIKAQFTANISANIKAIVVKRCPKLDNACIKLQAKNIVKDAVKLTTKVSAQLATSINASLSTKIQSCIDVELKKFSVNLLIIKLSVTGGVDIKNSIALKFKAAAGICAKACSDLEVKETSQIKTICAK